MDHERDRAGRNLDDRRETLLRVVRQALEEAGVHDERVGGHEQGVAVGRGAGDLLGADVAAGARLVLDDDGCPQRFWSSSPSRRARMSMPVPGV